MKLEITTSSDFGMNRPTSLFTNEKDDDFENIQIEKDDIVIKDNFYRTIQHRFGNTFTFFVSKEGDPLIVIGPHCNE